MKKLAVKLLIKVLCWCGIHQDFRNSRFNDFYCLNCGKKTREAVTYDNGHVPPDYKGLLYKADNPDHLYRLNDTL